MKKILIAGMVLLVLLIAAAVYIIYTVILFPPSPDAIPPGFLSGNITIVGSEDRLIDPADSYMLAIVNQDGWKYATPAVIERWEGHYSHNTSLFPGHFRIYLMDNKNYTSTSLPVNFTIESGKTTVVDIKLTPRT